MRLVDRIAYVNHDIDDALRAGVLAEADLPQEEIAVLGESGSERIDRLVHDLVETSERAGDIVQSEEVGGAMARLRKFMFERVYFGEAARREQERVTHDRGGAARALPRRAGHRPGLCARCPPRTRSRGSSTISRA